MITIKFNENHILVVVARVMFKVFLVYVITSVLALMMQMIFSMFLIIAEIPSIGFYNYLCLVISFYITSFIVAIRLVIKNRRQKHGST
jgi:hypothetical protein